MGSATLAGPMEAQQLNGNLYVGYGELRTIQQAVDKATKNGGAFQVVIPTEYAGGEDPITVLRGSASIFILDLRGGQWQSYIWFDNAYRPEAFVQKGGVVAPAINRTIYVGTGGKYNTIQSAVTDAVAFGIKRMVEISPGYTGNEVIGDLTGGSTDVYLTDTRTASTQNYIWNGTNYVPAPVSLAGDVILSSLTVTGDTIFAGSVSGADGSLNVEGDITATGDVYGANAQFTGLGQFDNLAARVGGFETLNADDLAAENAIFNTCEVDNSPVRTFANTPDGPGEGMVWPTDGVPVSLGDHWLNPSLDPDTLVRTNPAINTTIDFQHFDFVIRGSAPPAIAGNPPINTSVMQLNGATGQATTGTTGQIASNGAGMLIQGGNGGIAPAGSTNGNGGNLSINAGRRGMGAGTAGLDGIVEINKNWGHTYIGGTGIAPTTPSFHVAPGGAANGPTFAASTALYVTSGSTFTTEISNSDVHSRFISYYKDATRPGDVEMMGLDSTGNQATRYFQGLWNAGSPQCILGGNTVVAGALTTNNGLFTTGTYGSAPPLPSVFIDYLAGTKQGRFIVFGDSAAPTVVPGVSISGYSANQSKFNVYFEGHADGSVYIPGATEIGNYLTVHGNANGAVIPGDTGGGTRIAWNLPGGFGNTVFVNYHGSGGGGFRFYSVADNIAVDTNTLTLCAFNSDGTVSLPYMSTFNPSISFGGKGGNDPNVGTTPNNRTRYYVAGISGSVWPGRWDVRTQNLGPYLSAGDIAGLTYILNATTDNADGTKDAMVLHGSGYVKFGGGVSTRGPNWDPGVSAGNFSYNALNTYVDSVGDASNMGKVICRVMRLGGAGIVNQLEVNATGIYVAGTIGAGGAKAFIIPHPLDDTKELWHACLEGPESGVYYRGEGETVDGKAVIKLPDYFEALTLPDQRTTQLTERYDDEDNPSFGCFLAAGRVRNGQFTVRSSVPAAKFYWEVKAVRADIPALEVVRERTYYEKGLDNTKEAVDGEAGTDGDGKTENGKHRAKDKHAGAAKGVGAERA